MAQASRNPTSDEAVLGTWTGTPSARFAVVDDYPDSTGSDFLTLTALSGGVARLTFGYPVFSIPIGSTITSVIVRYYDFRVGSGASVSNGVIKVGGSYYPNATTHNPATNAWIIRAKTWTTNPATGAAWTAEQVNGTAGADNLQAFGYYSTDATPNIQFSSALIEVNYTPPSVTGTFGPSLAGDSSAAQVIVRNPGVLSSLLTGVTSTFSGTVTVSDRGGFRSLFWLEGGGASAVGSVTGTIAPTLTGVTASFSGALFNPGFFSSALSGVTMSAFGNGAGISGYFSLMWMEGGGAGAYSPNPAGSIASALDPVATSFSGIVALPPGTFSSTLSGVTASFSGFTGSIFAGFRSLLWLEAGGAGAIPLEPFRIPYYDDGVPAAWYSDPGYASVYAYNPDGIPVNVRNNIGSVSGDFAATLFMLMAASGQVIADATGTIASALTGDSLAILGTVGAPEGQIDSTLAGVTAFDFTGLVTAQGPITAALDGVSAAFSGGAQANPTGSFVSTLDNVQSSALIIVELDADGAFASTLEGVYVPGQSYSGGLGRTMAMHIGIRL